MVIHNHPSGNPELSREAPTPSSFVGKLAVALVCLSCVFFLTSAQDVFNLPKLWLASLGVLVGFLGYLR
jgi:type IV secretory pathway TrbL component